MFNPESVTTPLTMVSICATVALCIWIFRGFDEGGNVLGRALIAFFIVGFLTWLVLKF